MNELQNILAPDETITWSALQNRRLLLAQLAVNVIFVTFVGYLVSGLDESPCSVNGQATTCNPSRYAMYVYLLGYAGVGWLYLSAYLTSYHFTTKRVLIKSGIIGRDFKSIYFEQVNDCNVNVGLIDKLFGTGTVSVDTHRLRNLDEPYSTYQTLQTILRKYKEALYK